MTKCVYCGGTEFVKCERDEQAYSFGPITRVTVYTCLQCGEEYTQFKVDK